MKRVQKKSVAPFGSLFVVERKKLEAVVGGKTTAQSGCTSSVDGYYGSNGTGYDTSGSTPEATDIVGADTSGGYVGFFSGVWDIISK